MKAGFFRPLRKIMQPDGWLMIQYQASFWDGPCAPGETGKYVTKQCVNYYKGGRFLNAVPNVSYYRQLVAAVA